VPKSYSPANRIFQVEYDDQTVIVVLQVDLRELDFNRIEEQGKEILDFIGGPGVKNVVLDLAKTDYYGSTALSFFVKIWKRVRQRNGHVALCNLSAHEREPSHHATGPLVADLLYKERGAENGRQRQLTGHTMALLHRTRTTTTMATPSSSSALPAPPHASSLQDARLQAAAMECLRGSGYATLRGLRCDVHRAVVEDYGVVPSYYLKQMAQALLQRIDGIECVKNLVEVRHGERTPLGRQGKP
jgi:anti-anti-sigma factor